MNILNTLFVLAVASIATANPMANPGNNLETRDCATVLKSCEQHSDCCTGPSCVLYSVSLGLILMR